MAPILRSTGILLTGLVLLAARGAAQSFKLNGPRAREAGGGIGEMRISPDAAWVLYSGTQDSEVPGLFSVPIDGSGIPRRLASAEAGSVRWEFAGRAVVYTDSLHLFVSPLD